MITLFSNWSPITAVNLWTPEFVPNPIPPEEYENFY